MYGTPAPSTYGHLRGVPDNKKLLSGPLPDNKKLLSGTLPDNNLFLDFKHSSNMVMEKPQLGGTLDLDLTRLSYPHISESNLIQNIIIINIIIFNRL